MELHEVKTDIENMKSFWYHRNLKFKEWYEFLILIDLLATKNMETYVSNEPQTFYNMSHYLLTKGEISHTTSIESESAAELDRRAKVHRSCQYMWRLIDHERQLGGSQPFIDELSFFLLILGWYSTISRFDSNTGQLQTQIWCPYDTYPRYSNNRLAACVHSYKLTEKEAGEKAETNGWAYEPRGTALGDVVLDDYFIKSGDDLYNMILIDSKDVTGLIERPDMKLLVAPVGGFPDKGSLTPSKRDWRKLTGRGIFEVNEAVSLSFNKWKSMVSQILRDTAQPIRQEFSATPQATPEQLRERGALFHYAPGEEGLQTLPPPAIPIEIQANLLELRREMQKGSYNDAVFGMVEGQAGYALSLLASSSANQILYPYMDGKHFVVSENDKFWLSNLRASNKVFEVKGKFIEKLEPADIPEGVTIEVDSTVATQKDWLERGTIAGMLDKHLDDTTIVTEILGMTDPQGIKRRKNLDRVLDHEMSQLIELASGYEAHADYLEHRGDFRQAARFRKAAQALDAQMGVPPAGAARPEEATRVAKQVEEGTPGERARVSPTVAPPEARGFTPTELRRNIGRGSIRAG